MITMIMMRVISGANTIAFAVRICRPKSRMYETQIEHVDRILSRPVIQSVPIHAFVGGGVRDRQTAGLSPVECNKTNVAMAHRCLAEHVETVF